MTEDSVIGRSVIDREGVELGFITAIAGNYYQLGEGTMEDFKLHRSLTRVGAEQIELTRTIYDLLYEMKVYDSEGLKIGTVVEITETGDVLDTIIIDRLEDPDGATWDRGEDRHLYALLEEIAVIEPGRIQLRDTYQDLKFHNHEHTVRETIWEKVKHLFH